MSNHRGHGILQKWDTVYFCSLLSDANLSKIYTFFDPWFPSMYWDHDIILFLGMFFFFFGCMWDLSSLTRDWTPAQEAQSLNHWTTWKVLDHHSFRITEKINQGKDPELSKQWWGKGQSWRRSPPGLQSTMVDWKIFQWKILEKGSLRDTIQMPRIHNCSRDLAQLVISRII